MKMKNAKILLFLFLFLLGLTHIEKYSIYLVLYGSETYMPEAIYAKSGLVVECPILSEQLEILGETRC